MLGARWVRVRRGKSLRRDERAGCPSALPVRLSSAAGDYEEEMMKDNTSTLQHEEVLRHPNESLDLRSDQRPSDWVKQVLREARRVRR